MNSLNPIMQLVNDRFDREFKEKQQSACLGCAAAERRIRELEHLHRNDDAANRMLLDTCSRMEERIRQLEGRS